MMRRLVLLHRWAAAFSVLSIVMLTGCPSSKRALGIPDGTSRTPDFVLPLSGHDYNLALLYLDKKCPMEGGWEQCDIEEELKTLSSKTRKRFQPVLNALCDSQRTSIPEARCQGKIAPSGSDLDATGRVGSLFDPAGANDVALDARFQAEIFPADLRVGKVHGYYVVFYRRYSERRGDDVACPNARYCRLVIVDEVATRRY